MFGDLGFRRTDQQTASHPEMNNPLRGRHAFSDWICKINHNVLAGTADVKDRLRSQGSFDFGRRGFQRFRLRAEPNGLDDIAHDSLR